MKARLQQKVPISKHNLTAQFESETAKVTISEMYRKLILNGYPEDEAGEIVDLIIDESIAVIVGPFALELGLRWLHDRAADSRRRREQQRRQDPSGRWYG